MEVTVVFFVGYFMLRIFVGRAWLDHPTIPKWQVSLATNDIPIIATYGGWLRNPAPPKGWLKPYSNNM